MTILDPEGAMNALEDGTLDEIKKFFPLKGKRKTLVARKIYAGKDVDIDDINSQRKARLRGRTWSTGIYGDFTLVDNNTGKVVSKSERVKLVSLPKLTRRYSFIVSGTEYQADNQWRLKSGAYTRRKANGELETQFNLAKGRGFKLSFDPEKRRFLIGYGSSNIQLLPVLQALGISDETIKKDWGNALYSNSVGTKKKGNLVKMAKALDRRFTGKTDADAVPVIKEALANTEISPETTKATLGQSFSQVTGDTLLAAANKLLGVNKGTAKVDNRDALEFKELWSVQDHIPERIQNSSRRILFKLRNNVDRKDDVRSIITQDIFNVPVKAFFTSTSLSQQSSQVNPIDMIGGFLKTTITGTGGIGSANAITDDAKMIDNSHFGFVDPIHTPEGAKSGISTHLTLGVSKRGHEPTIRVYDTKSKEFVQVTPLELKDSNFAFADQYVMEKGKEPKPKGPQVTVMPKGGDDPTLVSSKDVDYIMPSAKQMFSMTANMVPFLPSDQANRAGMATRHMEQAIALKNREQPLVQTASGAKNPNTNTWEKIMGRLNSHRSKVSGTVSSVSEDKITIKGEDGKKHEVQLYNNYPLNDKKAFMHSTPLVKKGDKISKGQTVADTNFTKDGVLSIGTNLMIAYLPFKGLVFEDGIVISESASKKLTSEHMHTNRAYIDKNMGVGLKRFRANFPGSISQENADKLDEDGVIQKGQKVTPGDTLVATMQKTDPSKEQLLLKGIHKSLARPFKNKSLTWDKPYGGVVSEVVRNGREIMVYVRTEEPADIGDKLTGRHGNKGVITAVVPDEEMPRTKDGVPVQIIVNPSGVPGRINLGQVLETSLAKVAKEKGETLAVDNFQADDQKKIIKVAGHYKTIKTKEGPKQIYIKPYERELGYQEMVKRTLKEAGVSETDELIDPQTGKSYGQVLTGQQYILKLRHQVDKKLTARSHGYGHDYDATLIPKGGGKASAQRFGELGLYAMLSHGATANIRDALTYKSDKTQDEVWTAIQSGSLLPSPKPSFAYEKFLSYLKALGLNVEKEGNGLILTPLTDKQITSISAGALTDGSRVIRGKDLKPEKGGLFDEEITGGPGGKNWSHIALSGGMPNPIFEKGIISLLGITLKQYDSVIAGTAGFNEEGEVVSKDEASSIGASAIVEQLGRVNTEEDLKEAKEEIKTVSRNNLDKVNKRIKYLLMLKKTGLSAKEAYVLNNLPVLPPIFRPITAMEGGDLNIDGLNVLYRDIAILNKKVGEAEGVLPSEAVEALRAELYNAADALMGTASTSQQGELTLDGQARPPGILTIMSGRSSPKESFFHKKILDRKQDLTMRSVIVPDMDLHLDELGLPRKGAMKIYRPFVVKELVKMGYTPLQARDEVKKDTSLANKALDVVITRRPVLFKRDPVLHKFGVMAFKPKLHNENAIHIHPLVTGGFNADFDGDTMGVFVPISKEAVDEAFKMMPSRNLFNPSTGKVMYQPSLEGQLGLFLLTHFGKKTNKSFDSKEEAIKAAKDGEISMTDQVKVGGMTTTAGRLSFSRLLPKKLQKESYLTDKNMVMGKKNLQMVMREMAKETPGEFSKTIDSIKELGFGYSHSIGFSFNLNDFNTLSDIKKKHLDVAKKKETKILANKSLTKAKKDDAIVKLYLDTTAAINKDAKKLLEQKGNKLYAMNKAGVKPAWAQVQQMVLAPMLLENAKGQVIPVPVTRSYSEGLDTSGYWVSASGARKGLVEKVMAVQKPGALNKQIVNTAVPYVIAADDCGTEKGIALDINDANMVDRFTVKSLKLGGSIVPAGTLVTPNLLSKIKSNKISKVLVRSPLKCEQGKGMCSKCYGIMDDGVPVSKGTNIGVLAGTGISERATQLSMKSFHTGGVVGGGSSLVSGIDRVIQLLKIPKILPNAASLSPVSSTVTSIKKSPVGGFDIKIGNSTVYVPGNRTVKVKAGDSVKKGQSLTDGSIDPRKLLELTNIDTVQRYLSDELYKAYESQGIKRKNIEVLVKSITNLGKVDNPGDSEEFIKGDYAPLSYVLSLNKKNKYKNPIQVTPVLRGIETLPLDQSTDWVARLQYRKLKETFIRAANEGWESDIHGLHPAPGILYSAEFGKGKEGPY